MEWRVAPCPRRGRPRGAAARRWPPVVCAWGGAPATVCGWRPSTNPLIALLFLLVLPCP